MYNDPMSAQTDLYLIRHGQAVINVTAVMGGPKGDTGLTALGVRQAQALRDRIVADGEPQADVLIASTLPRAQQTAAIIAPALGLEPIPEDDLQEMRVGPDADGLSLEDFTKRYGWVDLAHEPFRRIDPGGESWASFMLRVATVLDRIAREQSGKRVVLVTHGGVVDGSLVHFFGMNAHSVPKARLHTANTSITHWRLELLHDHWIWRLMRYNDDHHLRQVGAEPAIDYAAIPAVSPES